VCAPNGGGGAAGADASGTVPAVAGVVMEMERAAAQQRQAAIH
jgi:hypothetical protein